MIGPLQVRKVARQIDGATVTVCEVWSGGGSNEEAERVERLVVAAPELALTLAEATGMLAAFIDILKGARARKDAVEQAELQHAKCLALLAKAAPK